MILRTYLALCKPKIIDGERVMLCFSKQDSFSKEAMEKHETKKEIEEMASEYFGMPVKIKPVFEDEVENKDDTEIEDVADENDVVKKAIELFGEDLVEVVEEE